MTELSWAFSTKRNFVKSDGEGGRNKSGKERRNQSRRPAKRTRIEGRIKTTILRLSQSTQDRHSTKARKPHTKTPLGPHIWK